MQKKLKNTCLLLLSLLLMIASGAALSRILTFSSALPLFLVPLLFIAWRFRFGPAALACIVSTLTLDFYFTEPRGTLIVGSSQDVAALVSFLTVVLVVSHLSSSIAAKTSRLRDREAAQKALHSLAERTLLLDWRTPIAGPLCSAVRACFALESVCLWDNLESRFTYDGAITDSSAARAAFMAERDFELPKIRQSIRLLCSGIRPVGSLQLVGDLPDPSIIGSIVSLVALSLERARALNGEVFAQSERTSEQLRTTVLDGLAHSIKTPLTTIALSSAGAVAIGGLSETQANLLRLVEEQTHYISGLTDTLLRTAKIEAKVRVRWQPIDLHNLIREVLRDLDPTARVLVRGLDTSTLIFSDSDLLRMALVQVLENALKYSPPASTVTLTVTEREGDVFLQVHNVGSYIPPEEVELVFKRFYRSPRVEQRAPGTGLGLSVARHSIEALGGQIRVESHIASGTTFSMELPIGGDTHARLSSYR